MQFIPGGEFIMGCDSLGDLDESPAHNRTVKSFFLGKYEVTQHEWESIMGNNPAMFKGENRPVECVSWEDVQLFIKKLNAKTGKKYRLPTEAEWEYAAKYGEFPLGLTHNEIAWWSKNSNKQTHNVGLKRPNSLGLYDMTGNVHEWCADYYDSLAYTKIIDSISQLSTPNEEVVARGGNWTSETYFLRVTNRNHAPKDLRSPTVGFRLALDSE